MKLLRELFEIIKVTKPKKHDAGVPALGMVPIASVVAGNQAVTEGKKSASVTLQMPKPRNKQVNDVLRSKKGGRMKAPTDFDRNAVKRDTQKAVMEADEDCCYFWYEVSWEVKDRSGNDGPGAIDRHSRGVLKADSKEDAMAKAKQRYPKAHDVRVGPSTKAKYDREME